MKTPRSHRSSIESYSTCSSYETAYSKTHELKSGIRKSVPAAIVVWAFRKLPSRQGLTSRRVIGFLKKHYKVAGNPRKTGRAIGKMLRFAVEFGLLRKRGNKYFLS